MNISVFGSSSTGNGYAVEFENGKILLLEAGTPARRFVEAFPSRWRDVIGVLVTHEHQDHIGRVQDYVGAGIKIYGTKQTFDHIKFKSPGSFKEITQGMFFDLINTLDDHIAAMPFAVIHNADDPVGYLIVDHKTDESLLFITDTAYMEYNFSNVTYMMIECNYIESIAQDKGNHATSQFHMSLETLKKFLYHCDLRKTKQIILIHLSDRNSNEEQMIREISGLTGIKTSVANAGDVYELRKDPF